MKAELNVLVDKFKPFLKLGNILMATPSGNHREKQLRPYRLKIRASYCPTLLVLRSEGDSAFVGLLVVR